VVVDPKKRKQKAIAIDEEEEEEEEEQLKEKQEDEEDVEEDILEKLRNIGVWRLSRLGFLRRVIRCWQVCVAGYEWFGINGGSDPCGVCGKGFSQVCVVGTSHGAPHSCSSM
jgi:hypothetical protein